MPLYSYITFEKCQIFAFFFINSLSQPLFPERQHQTYFSDNFPLFFNGNFTLKGKCSLLFSSSIFA